MELPGWLELGDLCAVRRLDGHVTGVCGPIPEDVLSTADFSRCQYGDPRQAGVRGQDFVPAERWMLGFENQAVILGALARARRSSTGAGERDEDLRLGAAAGALETGSNPGGSRQRGAALTAGAALPAGRIIEGTIVGQRAPRALATRTLRQAAEGETHRESDQHGRRDDERVQQRQYDHWKLSSMGRGRALAQASGLTAPRVNPRSEVQNPC